MSIQLKRGTSDAKSKSSVTLDAGQPFYETDTGKLYIAKADKTAIKDASLVNANDSEAAHLLANNTFTGTNKFTSNTLEVGDGVDYTSGNGKAAIFSATSVKLYDGAAGRNYTIKFPAYSSVIGGEATLFTNIDILSGGYTTASSNNNFTGFNKFKSSLMLYNVSDSGFDMSSGLAFSNTNGSTFTQYLGNRWITSTGALINLPTASGTLAVDKDIKVMTTITVPATFVTSKSADVELTNAQLTLFQNARSTYRMQAVELVVKNSMGSAYYPHYILYKTCVSSGVSQGLYAVQFMGRAYDSLMKGYISLTYDLQDNDDGIVNVSLV